MNTTELFDEQPMLHDVTQYLLYYPQFINPEEPTGLWFCDSVFDVDDWQINSVCLPSGGEWDDLNKCLDFFSAFPYLVIVSADDAKRAEMVREIRARITNIPIQVAIKESFHGCESIRDLRVQRGMNAVFEIAGDSKELPAYGLINLADVKKPDILKMPRALSGIRELDKSIGGFYLGELSIWTGKRGEGKSTFVSQCLVEAINQNRSVCAYSGELPDWRFREWVYKQIAGPARLDKLLDKETGQDLYDISAPIEHLIDNWLDNRFFLYDIGMSSAHDEDSIIRIFEYAVRRYGCDVFLVDNIMTARLKGISDKDFFRAQSNFVGRLVQFAKTNNVHVHVVAHPRKSEVKQLGADDVGGSGDITNRADNVFLLHRLSDEESEKQGFGSILSVLKNRAFGSTIKIGMNYDVPSHRYFKALTGNPNKKYSWEMAAEQVWLPFNDADNPFN